MSKMAFKDFIKPTIGKIILTIVLLIVFGFLFWSLLQTWTDLSVRGFPFIYYEKGIMPCSPSFPTCNDNIYFNIFYLLLDLIIWYLISCIIILIYNKFKRHK